MLAVGSSHTKPFDSFLGWLMNIILMMFYGKQEYVEKPINV